MICETVEERREAIKITLDDYIKRLHDQEGNNLLQVVLFGSVARGEETNDSDIDVLIIVRHSDREKEKDIYQIGLDVWSDYRPYSMRISPIVIELDSYREWYNKSLLYHNIRKEGVNLWL